MSGLPPSILGPFRLAFAHIRRVGRLQRAVAYATPAELDLREALEPVFALGPTRRVEAPVNPPAPAAMSEPVTVASSSPRALDAEIVERILRNCVERTAPSPPGSVN